MGRADLIGNGKMHLIPTFQPQTDGNYVSARRKNSTLMPKSGVAKAGVAKSSMRNEPTKGRVLTQHTGLPPRVKK
jgi:hypothetical protein